MDTSSDEYAVGPPEAPAPKPPTPPQPLPRLVRFNQPSAENERARPSRSERRKARKDKELAENGPGGLLQEQTPTLDTVETRQRIRVVAGVVLAVAAITGITLVYGAFRSGTDEDFEGSSEALAAADPTGPAQSVKPAARSADEGLARLVLDDARGFARKGDADNTVKRLERLVHDYPRTKAGEEAQRALENGRKGLPLFIDVPLVLAEAPAPAVETEPAPAPAPVVVVEPAPPPTPVGGAPVTLAPPLVSPEPRVDTGLEFEVGPGPPKDLPSGFRSRPESGVHPSGWPLEITCDQDGAAMVFVPGGTFVMGRNDGPASARPAHRVSLSPYYIDQHEITRGQFRLFQAATGARAVVGEREGPSRDRLPVTEVTAREAYDYARWAGKALPSEAQWELAARTIDGRPHPWGTGAPAWSTPRKPKQLDPVMSFRLDLSPYGAFDLAGNVREWCLDIFDPRYYERFRDQVAVEPTGPDRYRSRVPLLTIKGGSADWDSSWRDGMNPDARLPDLGFRCVLPLARPGPAQTPNPAAPASTPGGLVPF